MPDRLIDGSKYIINWCRWCGQTALKVRRTVQDPDGRTRRYAICPVCETSHPLTQLSMAETLHHSTSAGLFPEFHTAEFRSLIHAGISDEDCRQVLQRLRQGKDIDLGKYRPDLV